MSGATFQRNPRLRQIYSAGADPGLISDVLVVRESVIRKRPGQVAALIRAWDDAMRFYKARTARAQAIITRAVGARPGELETSFAGVKLYTVDDNLRALSPQGAFSSTLADVQAAVVDAGLVSAHVRAPRCSRTASSGPVEDGAIALHHVSRSASQRSARRPGMKQYSPPRLTTN